jgi:hypothetical protein
MTMGALISSCIQVLMSTPAYTQSFARLHVNEANATETNHATFIGIFMHALHLKGSQHQDFTHFYPQLQA